MSSLGRCCARRRLVQLPRPTTPAATGCRRCRPTRRCRRGRRLNNNAAPEQQPRPPLVLSLAHGVPLPPWLPPSLHRALLGRPDGLNLADLAAAPRLANRCPSSSSTRTTRTGSTPSSRRPPTCCLPRPPAATAGDAAAAAAPAAAAAATAATAAAAAAPAPPRGDGGGGAALAPHGCRAAAIAALADGFRSAQPRRWRRRSAAPRARRSSSAAARGQPRGAGGPARLLRLAAAERDTRCWRCRRLSRHRRRFALLLTAAPRRRRPRAGDAGGPWAPLGRRARRGRVAAAPRAHWTLLLPDYGASPTARGG